MSITDQQAIAFGTLAMIAEDMYVPVGSLNPPSDPRIAASGWTVVSYLTAHDALFPPPGAADRTLGVDPIKRVFFGFVAKNNADPSSFVAVVRGTEGIIEWIIDAEFLLIPHPRHPTAQVEQGFWNIYQTMSLAEAATGATTYQNAAEGVAALVGPTGTLVVTGHSLGSALATYFTDDLAERIGARVSACLFASPRTGDTPWANLFAATTVGQYRLFNYILDLVTHVPSIGYSTLPNATVIQPATAQAGVRLDILCDHHVICYCAMIDSAVAVPTTAQDASCAACILPTPPGMPESAKALATIINEFGVGDERAVIMLKALHEVNAM
jgi:triacylglycerol lipase